MFVDDSLFANVASIMKHAMAASIEALYLVLGFPDEPVRQACPKITKNKRDIRIMIEIVT